MQDNVNHPQHYTQASVYVEPINICRMLGFNFGNMFKYVARAPFKGHEKEDLEKAMWYYQDAKKASSYLAKHNPRAWGAICVYSCNSKNDILKDAVKPSNSIGEFFVYLAHMIELRIIHLEDNAISN